MNDIKNETVRFSMKPNPFLYALEFTRYVLVVGTVVELFIGIPIFWPGIHSARAVVLLLTAYVLLSLALFIVAFVTARHLIFVVTDKWVIVRSSFWRTTTDRLSVAIVTVTGIEITSYGTTYGSVYLSFDKTSSHENSKRREPYFPQPGPIRRTRNEVTRASIPIKRANSIVVAMNHFWPCLHGFYAFKGFDEFANIISGQQSLRSEFQRAP